MTKPPFLSRKTFGAPNYFLIALVLAAGVALIPRAARQAHDSNNNRAEDWLPADYPESSDLRWFRKYFFSEGFIVVSWDGCTLGNTEKLNLLAAKLSSRVDTIAQLQREQDPGTLRINPEIRAGKWFREIITGPTLIEELTGPPLSLGYADAVRRLEGAIVGPPERDAEGRPLGDETRTTCLVAYLAPDGYRNNEQLRKVVDYVTEVAEKECGIPAPQFHMGGPPVDNVSIDRAGESSLIRLVSLSGIVGFAITYWCLGSFSLTGVVVAVGAVSAAMSLAMVFYYGVIEVFLLGYPAPHYGTMDAILMTMPAVVYVLGLSGAIHLVNYYRDIREECGLKGAAEKAVRMAWPPCFLASFTTAVGLGSLVASDIVPIKKFGGFTAVAVLATLAVLFSMLPVFLHRFPPKLKGIDPSKHRRHGPTTLPPWMAGFAQLITRRYAIASVLAMTAMITVGYGVTKIQSSVQLLKLLDEESDLVQDYHWLENHMGNLVPMEVVVTLPAERCRTGDEHAEQDGKQYRLTMLERMDLVRRILRRIEGLGEISRTLSASTFSPEASENLTATWRRTNEYTINTNLEENRQLFRDYLRVEAAPEDESGNPGRELWRISARVTALKDIDYGQFVDHLHAVIRPVLSAYLQRDLLIRRLHEDGKRLEGAQICFLVRGEPKQIVRDDSTAEGLFYALLHEGGLKRRSGDHEGKLRFVANADLLNLAGMTIEQRAEAIAEFGKLDAVVFVDGAISRAGAELAKNGVPVLDLSEIPDLRQTAGSASKSLAFDANEPRPIRAVYTGIIPLVHKTQSQLLVSLRESIIGAVVLNWIVLVIVFRSVFAGLIAMIPNVFPIFLVFGALGWLGVKVEIGIMMTASVALGIAIDGTVHFLTWFRDGLSQGLSRRDSVLLAYERCAAAMMQTTLIAGLGILVFGFSTFTPTQQFGYMMVTTLAAALIGDLILLPSLLCGPLGKFFSAHAGVHMEAAEKDAVNKLSVAAPPESPISPAPPLVSESVDMAESPEFSDMSANGNGSADEKQPEPISGPAPHNPTAAMSLREKLRKYRLEARHDSNRSL